MQGRPSDIQEKIMPEKNVQKQNRAKIQAVICACAILGAIGGGIFSMLMLMIFWGMNDSSTFGILIGFPVGLFVGGGSSIWLIRKQIRFLYVMLVSTFLAFIIACLATLIIWIMI
jgi:hypothetical protein